QHRRIIHPCADIGDLAFANLARNYGGLPVEPPIALAIRHEHLRVRCRDAELHGPYLRGSVTPDAAYGNRVLRFVIDRVELLDPSSEQAGQRTRFAFRPKPIV